MNKLLVLVLLLPLTAIAGSHNYTAYKLSLLHKTNGTVIDGGTYKTFPECLHIGRQAIEDMNDCEYIASCQKIVLPELSSDGTPIPDCYPESCSRWGTPLWMEP